MQYTPENNRIMTIEQITSDPSKIERVHKLPLEGGETYNVYKIPLDSVVFYPENDRFASIRLSYPKEFENKNEQEIQKFILDTLWNKSIKQNIATGNSLIRDGQQIPAVINESGVIWSGNRRACILKLLFTSDRRVKQKILDKHKSYIPQNNKYIECIVLSSGEYSEQEIALMETRLQYDDDKVSYDAIEKYLKVNRLWHILKKDYGQIGEFMKVTPKKVESMKKVHECMCDYLENYLHQKNNFDLIREKEDLFINLSSTLSKIKNGNWKSHSLSEPETNYDNVRDLSFLAIRAYAKPKVFREFLKDSNDINKATFIGDSKTFKHFQRKLEGIADCQYRFMKNETFDNAKEREKYFSSKVADKFENVYNEISNYLDTKNSQTVILTAVEKMWSQFQIIESVMDNCATQNISPETKTHLEKMMKRFPTLMEKLDKK